MISLRTPLILLGGAFFSFIFAYLINAASFLPDPELTEIPFILSPLIVSILIASKSDFIKHHQLFMFIVGMPIFALIFGFYLFAFVLRNLH